MFLFSVQLTFETFLIIRRTGQDIIKNVHWSSCKVPVILVRFEWSLTFFSTFSKNAPIPNFMNTRPARAELFYTDGRTDKHDEANCRFSQNLRTRLQAPYHQLAATYTTSSHTYCVRIAATLRDGRQKGRGSTPGKDIFYGRHNFQTGCRVRPPSCLMGRGTLPMGLKLPRRKADHSRTSTSQVRNAWIYVSTPLYIFTT